MKSTTTNLSYQYMCIENNNYFAINTMSLYVHIHCIKAKLQQLLNAQETFKYNFK